MTGKDFSGPTPVIHTKTPPNLTALDSNAAGEQPDAIRKKSRTPGPVEEVSGVKRSSTVMPNKRKGKGREEEGVEILGSTDAIWED
jgi:hypothetical protein